MCDDDEPLFIKAERFILRNYKPPQTPAELEAMRKAIQLVVRDKISPEVAEIALKIEPILADEYPHLMKVLFDLADDGEVIE